MKFDDICINCGGTETELAEIEDGIMTCKNRELCRATMIFENMIARVKSA